MKKQIQQEVARLEQEKEKLKDAIYQLENIISMMPGHVYWVDKNNVFLGCNKNQARTIGLKSRDEIVGKTVSDFQNKQNTSLILKNNNNVMRNGKKIVSEEKIYLADGVSEGVMLSFKNPLYNKNGKIIGLLGISLDITDRKKVEQQLQEEIVKAKQANLAKTKFIANISHDIRTPLSGIIGLSQILEKKSLTKKNREYAKLIHIASNKLLETLNNVIEFSKIESSKIQIINSEFNLKEMITATINMLTNKKKQVGISLHYANNIPRYIVGDNMRINRILLNLLNNAIKFTLQGHINIIVKFQNRKNTTADLQLTVADTGIGIPEDKLTTVFNRFTRTEESYRSNQQGTGLGLTIVKQFIDEIGGKITLQSKLNIGSTFTCTIPITTSKKRRRSKKSSKLSVTKKTISQKYSLLLIEDDRVCQLAEEMQLQDLGYKVTMAKNGKEALRLSEQKYDLIVGDIGLPDIDGLELAKTIRTSDNPNHNTPIITLSAHTDNKLEKRCFAVGINAVMIKPFNIEQFHDIVAKIFNSEDKKNR